MAKLRAGLWRFMLGTVLVAATLLVATDGESEDAVGPGTGVKTAIPPRAATFEPDRFLISTGGEASKGGSGLVLSPEVGLSHTAREREQPGGIDNVTHKVHAQAGGRVSLYDRFYLGFATKLPIYNYEAASGESAAIRQQQARPRHEYELLRLSPENLGITGELGYRIGQRLHLNIYYDQNRYRNPSAVRGGADEDVFGTRMIYRFR